MGGSKGFHSMHCDHHLSPESFRYFGGLCCLESVSCPKALGESVGELVMGAYFLSLHENPPWRQEDLQPLHSYLPRPQVD